VKMVAREVAEMRTATAHRSASQIKSRPRWLGASFQTQVHAQARFSPSFRVLASERTFLLPTARLTAGAARNVTVERQALA